MNLPAVLHRDVKGRQAAEKVDKRLIAHWLKELEHLHHRTGLPVIMFDTIEPDQIPPTAQAVAGYVGGRWPTFPELVRTFPHAQHVSLAVAASEDAEGLDIETGDASPAEAPSWVRRQWARGVERPILYGNLFTMGVLKPILRSAAIPRQRVRLWVANPTGVPHIPPGYDACQWTWHALGRNLDQSQLVPDFFS